MINRWYYLETGNECNEYDLCYIATLSYHFDLSPKTHSHSKKHLEMANKDLPVL